MKKFNKNVWHVQTRFGARSRPDSVVSIDIVSCFTRLTPLQWIYNLNVTESVYSVVSEVLQKLVIVSRTVGYGETILPVSAIEKITHERQRVAPSKESGVIVISTLLDLQTGKPFELEVIFSWVVPTGQGY